MIHCIDLVCACALIPGLQDAGKDAADAGKDATPKPIFAHEGAITHLRLGAQGKVLYTATDKKKIHAWNLKKGEFLWHGDAHVLLKISGLAVGKKKIFYTGRSPAYRTLDLKTGKGKKGGTGGPNPMEVCTSLVGDPKGRWVWLGTEESVVTRLTPGNINAWSRRRMKNDGVTCLARDAGAKLLAVGGKGGSVHFIKIANAKRDEKKILKGHASPVSALAFDKRGSTLASGSSDGMIHVWTVANGKGRFELKGHDKPIRGLAFDPSGKWIASGDAGGVVRLWDAKKGKKLAILSGADAAPVAGMVFLSKGKLAVASGKGVTILDLSAR